MPTTINLKKIGGLVKAIIIGDPPGTERTVYEDRKLVRFINPDEDPVSGDMRVTIGDQDLYLSVVTNVLFDGVAATDIADFEAKLPTVFPDEGGGSTTPGTDGSALNEIVKLTDVDTYRLLWTDARKLAFGDSGVFQVEIKGADDIYRQDLVEIIPDDIDNTSYYDFDFGGSHDVRITIT